MRTLALVLLIVTSVASTAAADTRVLGRSVGTLSDATRALLEPARRILAPFTVPKPRGRSAYASWLNKTYGPRARRDRADLALYARLREALRDPNDRTLASSVYPFLLEAIDVRTTRTDAADPDAAIHASAGIGVREDTQRAQAVVDAARACVEATKDVAAPWSSWATACEGLLPPSETTSGP